MGHKGRERRRSGKMAARSVGEKAGSTSLVERLAFYESYHGNFWNKVIHVVCIPLIVWGVLVALCKVPLLGTNLGALTTAAYCAMYTLADPASGLTWGAFVGLPLYSSAIKAVVALGPTASNLWGLAAFVFGFYFQVHVGHMVFEKRKPALVDGFVEVSTMRASERANRSRLGFPSL